MKHSMDGTRHDAKKHRNLVIMAGVNPRTQVFSRCRALIVVEKLVADYGGALEELASE